MRIGPGIAVAVVFTGLAVAGSTSPARADDFSGTYTVNVEDGSTATWTVVPCEGSEQQPFVQCVHITESGGGQPWTADAYWQVGYWTTYVERPDAIVCDDGRTFPERVGYAWDAANLSGWVSNYYRGPCGGPRGNLAVPFTLTKVGAAEAAPAEANSTPL